MPPEFLLDHYDSGQPWPDARPGVAGSDLAAAYQRQLDVRRLRIARDLMPGDVVTTGTWADAWPVAPLEQWTGQFSPPLARLRINFL